MKELVLADEKKDPVESQSSSWTQMATSSARLRLLLKPFK